MSYLGKYDFVKEVVVWNNNPDLSLTEEGLRPPGATYKIKLIKATSNQKDLSKYQACAAASFPNCFYQDDDWFTEGYLPGLYHAYLKEKDFVHAATDARTVWANWKWSFFDDDESLGAVG